MSQLCHLMDLMDPYKQVTHIFMYKIEVKTMPACLAKST